MNTLDDIRARLGLATVQPARDFAAELGLVGIELARAVSQLRADFETATAETAVGWYATVEKLRKQLVALQQTTTAVAQDSGDTLAGIASGKIAGDRAAVYARHQLDADLADLVTAKLAEAEETLETLNQLVVFRELEKSNAKEACRQTWLAGWMQRNAHRVLPEQLAAIKKGDWHPMDCGWDCKNHKPLPKGRYS